MVFCLIAAVLAAVSTVQASPAVRSKEPVHLSASSFCAEASSFLAPYTSLSAVSHVCASFPGIRPATSTTTSTYTQPLTEVYGIVSTVYASPAPPGITTAFPSPVSKDKTTTTTSTTTVYTASFRYYTETDTVTTNAICTTAEPALVLAIQSACDCIGFPPPTKTRTVYETTTGDFTVVTTMEVETYSPTTTYPPSATITETTSTPTVYAGTVTKTVTYTSTFIFDEPLYSMATATETSCTATTTVADLRPHHTVHWH